MTLLSAPSGVRFEVSDDMLPSAYIGYDESGNAVCSGMAGSWHVQHSAMPVRKFIVGRSVWGRVLTPAPEARQPSPP